MAGYSVGAMKKVTAMKPDDFSSFNFDTRFIFPFTMLITGPTGSGKTMFVKELLEKQGTKYKSKENLLPFWNSSTFISGNERKNTKYRIQERFTIKVGD